MEQKDRPHVVFATQNEQLEILPSCQQKYHYENQPTLTNACILRANGTHDTTKLRQYSYDTM